MTDTILFLETLTVGEWAGICGIIAYIWYVIEIFRGNAEPSPVTWLVLSFMGAVLAVQYYYSGAGDSLYLAIGNAVGPFIIAVLTFKYGVAWTRFDTYCILGALLSIAVWAFTKSPEWGLGLSIVIDLWAILSTWRKVFRLPFSEPVGPWALTEFASMLGVASLSLPWDPIIAAYPVYLLIIDGLILGTMLVLQRKGNMKPAAHS